MNASLKSIVFLSILYILNYKANAQQLTSPDGVLKYTINTAHENRDDLLGVVKKVNPNIVKIEMIKVKGTMIPFAISKYEGDHVDPLELVLKKYVYNVKANSATRIIEAKSFQHNRKYFHRKVTVSTMGGKEAYNVMYYFMKNNKSNILYEMKLDATGIDRSILDKALFEIAKTVEIK